MFQAFGMSIPVAALLIRNYKHGDMWHGWRTNKRKSYGACWPGCAQEHNDFNKNIALSYAAYKVGPPLCAADKSLRSCMKWHSVVSSTATHDQKP